MWRIPQAFELSRYLQRPDWGDQTIRHHHSRFDRPTVPTLPTCCATSMEQELGFASASRWPSAAAWFRGGASATWSAGSGTKLWPALPSAGGCVRDRGVRGRPVGVEFDKKRGIMEAWWAHHVLLSFKLCFQSLELFRGEYRSDAFVLQGHWRFTFIRKVICMGGSGWLVISNSSNCKIKTKNVEAYNSPILFRSRLKALLSRLLLTCWCKWLRSAGLFCGFIDGSSAFRL